MKFLLDFDILYDKMTDMEKKEFMNTFIEKIELKNETVNNGTSQVRALNILILRFRCIMEIVKGQEFVCPKKTQSRLCAS